jgi:serine protease AprX
MAILSRRSSTVRVAVSSALALATITLLAPVDANAQHRARVARSLDAKVVDGNTETVRALVTAPSAEVDRIERTYGVRVVKRLDIGAVIEGAGGQMSRVAGDSLVGAIAADEVVVSTMGVSTQSTGANLVWGGGNTRRNFGGLTGSGVGVAVIDSGIGAHPDVVNRLRMSLDFTEGDETVADGYGHGTHIAGIIAGSGRGSRSADGSEYVGMAPGAELLSLKVLGSDGSGYVSDVIEAIEWVVRHRARHKIRIINLSLGHVPSGNYLDDPMAQAVERAVAAGLVVVASAGNLGKTADGKPIVGAVVSPGYTPGALTVGALNTKGTVVRSDDGVATYSSRGPVGDPDNPRTWEIKPDVVAPGNAIVSAGLAGSYLYETYPDRRVVGANGGTYLKLSGTSMAAGVVSGAAALLLHAQPRLSPAEVKFALQYTAERLEGFGLIEQGAGSINVPLAAALAEIGRITASPTKIEIAGELVESGEIAFANTLVWGGRGLGLAGNTLVWGGRGPAVDGHTLVWGGRVFGETLVWGGRGVNGDTLVWGGRGVNGDTLVWGGRGINGDTLVWGGRGINGDTLVWGGRGINGDTLVWGGRGVNGDTLVWGGRGINGETLVWGGRGINGETLVWGGRGIDGETLVWGGRGVNGDTLVWGGRNVSADTLVWGGRLIWGSTLVWGGRIVTGETLVWGGRTVTGDTLVWGGRSVNGDTLVWGGRGVSGDTLVWGGRSVSGDTLVWGGRNGTDNQ